MIQLIGFGLAFIMVFIAVRQLTRIGKRSKISSREAELFPAEWKQILSNRIPFYQHLNAVDKSKFEFKVQEFLLNCTVSGIDTTVDDTDRLLIASSAVIPIFNFPDWSYRTISEVLLYPDTFNEHFHTEGGDRVILGMVGEGHMQGKMILSKRALHHGFQNETDKKNTAIHEFVHLIDKSDGYTDGVPEILLQRQYVLPWLKLIQENIEEIHKGKSDINPYAASNTQEFLAVISEYFFEQPQLLKDKHPELHGYMELMFGKR